MASFFNHTFRSINAGRFEFSSTKHQDLSMSVNRNDEVSLSDRYVLLLQSAIKESRELRAQVAMREEERQESDSKMERLLNRVEELCEKVSCTESNSSGGKKKGKRTASVKVPSQCRVSFLLLICFK